MTTSTIKYRINSVTSQSENYPAYNLTNQNTSLGWQTQYSPTYPQQLNLQFFTPIRTKTLKMVFHQYKIPSFVEVFVRLTSKQNYRKLGFVIPNQNSQSSYQHKEIKTLYFQFPCNYIKLVFYQNFKNQMNLFEQVGLEQLVVQGETMTYNEIRNLDLTEQQQTSDDEQHSKSIPKSQSQSKQNEKPLIVKSGFEQTSSTDEINKKFNQVFTHLQSQKSQAVQNQDFQLAAHLKNAIQAFKDIQSDIHNLQLQKQQALQDEDFDKCHRIKQEIMKKKEQFQYRVDQLIANEDNFMAEYSHSRIGHENINPQTTQRKDDNIKDYFSNTPEREQLNKQKQLPVKKLNEQPANKSYVDHNQQIIPTVRNKLLGIQKTQENQYMDQKSIIQQEKINRSIINRKQNSKSPTENLKGQKKSIKSPKKQSEKRADYLGNQNNNVKSPILGYQQNQDQNQSYTKNNQKKSQQIRIEQNALKSKETEQGIQNAELNQLRQRFKHLKLQPLDLKLRMKLQSHFNVIDEPYWEMIMHKSWSVKKLALQYIKENVQISNKQTYIAALEFISFSIEDTHTQVVLESLRVLRKIIEEGNDNQVIFSLPHLPYFVQTIMNALLTLVNSTNKQLAQESYNIYLLLGMINFLSIQQIIQKLTKHKQTTKVNPQYLVVKIGLMISIIQKYNESTKYYKDIIQWVMYFLEDPSQKVRTQASYVLLILTDIVGEDKIIQIMKDKPKILEAFNNVLSNNSVLVQQSRVDQSSRVVDESRGRVNQNSRITDKNLSKLSENPSVLANKSLSRQKLKSLGKNPSQISQNKNPSSHFDQHKRLKNPWNGNSKLGYKEESNIRVEEQRNEDQLQYSKQSDFYGSSIKKPTPSNVYMNRGYQNQQFSHNQSQNQIRVLEEEEQQHYGYHEQQDQQEDHDSDPSKCDYCFMDLNGLDQRNHLMMYCKVIAYCEECGGRIYIRQIIEHLLEQCPQKTHHQKCKKCGLVFNINEINEHVGQGLCRLQRGQGWERCQFCGQDVLSSDNKWVQHSYKCPNLPEKPHTETENVTQKYSDNGDL